MKAILIALLVSLTACHHGHGHGSLPPLSEVAIAVPIAPGKTAAWRAAIEELTGPRYAEYEASRKRFGVTAQATFLQQTPMGDFAVIHLTAPDVYAAFHAMSTSQDPWDVKWREMTTDLHGIDFARGERVTPQVTLAYSMDSGTTGGQPFMFLAPLGAGGADRLRAIATELNGPRHADYVRARAAAGIRRELVFLETTAMGDAAVFYWLADDPQASLASLAASTDSFDVWLRDEMTTAHPIEPAQIGEIASHNVLVGEYPHRAP